MGKKLIGLKDTVEEVFTPFLDSLNSLKDTVLNLVYSNTEIIFYQYS